MGYLYLLLRGHYIYLFCDITILIVHSPGVFPQELSANSTMGLRMEGGLMQRLRTQISLSCIFMRICGHKRYYLAPILSLEGAVVSAV